MLSKQIESQSNVKQLINTKALIVILSGFTSATHGQPVVLSENLDFQSLCTFGTACTFAGGTVTEVIVSLEQGGDNQALPLNGNVTNSTAENAGVNSPVCFTHQAEFWTFGNGAFTTPKAT